MVGMASTISPQRHGRIAVRPTGDPNLGAGRFLILARDGAPEPNLVWRDTVLIPMGQTVDLLLELTHPGEWLAHYHIADTTRAACSSASPSRYRWDQPHRRVSTAIRCS